MGKKTSTSYKKGETGNSKGRPPKEICLSEILKTRLDMPREIKDEKTGKTIKIDNVRDYVVDTIIKLALKGDTKAINIIFDRTEGKAKQKIEAETTITNGVNIKVEFDEDSSK